MKKALFLVDDYWHKADTIRPLVNILFDQSQWNVIFTTCPDALYTNQDIDLFLSFKDPIENDQILTPIWCDDKWTRLFMNLIHSGVGFIAVHAAVTDLKKDHPLVADILHSVFITHPEQCKVSVKIIKEHPVTAGITDFVLPEKDEHYQMKMIDDTTVTILANTISLNGVQPGLWVSEYGKGKVCCFTPGHTTVNMTCDGYTQILKNAIAWCECYV